MKSLIAVRIQWILTAVFFLAGVALMYTPLHT